ncbi:hypothetical protein ACFL6H_04825 [Candidatus Latescibacterota bacterium]
MLTNKENKILERIQMLEKRLKELEEKIKNRNETLLDEYLKTHGFK